MELSTPLKKVLYGVAFNLLLPVSLAAWAMAVGPNLLTRLERQPAVGLAVGLPGFMLVAVGLLTIIVKGQGLPMNPWPPARFVQTGIYRLMPHPIYTGAVLACAGLSLFRGSAAGLLLVTPMLALGALALVAGFEAKDLERRFGPRTTPVLLSLPLSGSEAPSLFERVGAGLVVGGALSAVLGELVMFRLLPWDGALTALSFGAIVLQVALVPGGSRDDLRTLVVHQGVALALAAAFVLFSPVSMGEAQVLLVALGTGMWRRAQWSRLTGSLLALGYLGAVWVTAPSMGVLEGFALGLISAESPLLWRGLRTEANALANSWRDWRFGPVRIIGHGTVGALTCAPGVFLATCFVGPVHAWAVLWATVAAIVGAALWAQWVEGSNSIARPYGFFGGVLGIIVFALMSDAPRWVLLGAFCAAGPVIQGLGRLRCVANGCCHGAPCPPSLGLVYTHPMTRPVRLANLAGVPIHPTQLYSMGLNFLSFPVLWRMWVEHTRLALICGVYLLLMGLGRFVEEAVRGEPQTQVLAGLRLYQWVAMLCAVAGAVVSCLPDTPNAPAVDATSSGLWVTAAFASLTWLIASVDFPDSRARFARLA